MQAKYRHQPSKVLEHANKARSDPSLSTQATFLMIDTYLQPPVDAVWANETLDMTAMVTALDNCTQLLQSLPPRERNNINWQVISSQAGLQQQMHGYWLL
jgi:hypothetical protein